MADTDRFDDVAPDAGIEGYDPEFVDVAGTRTRYYDEGSGDPLLLLHGGNWGGFVSANDWTPTFEHLRDDFRVLALDRLACGLTENPEDREDYRHRTELDHALDFLETLGVDSCHVGGSSRGAGLATRMAVEEPDRFETLIILNSGTLGPPTGDKSYRRDRIFERYAPDLEPTDPDYVRFFYEQYSHQLENVTDEFCAAGAYIRSRPKAMAMAETMDDHHEAWRETMLGQMETARRRIREGVLDIPTLYLFGRNDLTVPLEMAMSAYDMIAQENPAVRLKVINECGHIIYREHPAEFARSVIDFVEFWH